MRDTFHGFERENGRIGVRNHVLIIPVDDISNNAAQNVERSIVGVRAVPHPYGRLQFGKDLDLLFRTLSGIGRNPNVASAIVIGIEDKWAEKVADGISQTGKHVESISIEEKGDLETVRIASRWAAQMVKDASELNRREFSVSELTVSTKCGESDTTSGLASNPTVGRTFEYLADQGATLLFGETSELTGAENIVASKIADVEIRKKFDRIFQEYQDEIRKEGVDLLGSQPTEGNIKGGLTTIEEKALGNVEKAGNLPVVDVLGYAEEPRKKGLNFMNSSSAAAECVTLFSAAGAVVHIFTTGQGNIVGNPVEPVIKVTANPRTARTMSEHIDVDLSGLLEFSMTLDEAAAALHDATIRTASGKLTSNEVLGHFEFSPTKLHISA